MTFLRPEVKSIVNMKITTPKPLNLQRITYLTLVLICISCLDFQFESEYEDINGIYLEQIAAYDIQGEKIITDNDIGYIINANNLLIFDFTNGDSIFPLCTYTAYDYIRDFAIERAYAYLVHNFGLEIIHTDGSSANLTGSLDLPNLHEIRIMHDRAYIISGAYRNRIEVVDVLDKANPTLIDSVLFDEVIIQIEVDSSLAYVLLANLAFYAIDINDPNLTTYLLSNFLGPVFSFVPDGNFIHFSGYRNAFKLMTYTITDNNELDKIWEIDCPAMFYRLEISGWYGLGLPGTAAIYLFELKDHARPYIAERLELPTSISGTIDGDYIYVLSPLKIIQIKQIEQ